MVEPSLFIRGRGREARGVIPRTDWLLRVRRKKMIKLIKN